MSLENIDEKFKKVAQSISNSSNQDDQKKQEPKVDPDQETYEQKINNKKVSGLLSVFENHLRKQMSATGEEKNSEEFRTVSVTSSELIHNPTEGTEKVTEEEINSLINFSTPQSNSSENENVTSQKRYEDLHETIDNVASIDDLNSDNSDISSSNIQTPNQVRYTDSVPVIDNRPMLSDVDDGLPPVNVTKKKDDAPPPAIPTETENVDLVPEVSTDVSANVMRHIEEHRKQKQTTGLDNYIKEDKN